MAEIEARIESKRARLAAHPRLYPVWAELGEALLDAARIGREPERVAEARQAFDRSLEIQPNFVAWRGEAALANFRHRFDEALEWARLAESAYPEDTSVLGLRIEALVSLGRAGEADAWFLQQPPADDDFHSRAARARVHCAAGRTALGAAEFLDAAALARTRSPALAQWAMVRAAAAWIDTGEPARARPLLEEARKLVPDGIDVNVHLSEVDEAEGRPAAALARYEELLARDDDPTVHAAAARVARQLGQAPKAERHFHAAEESFRRALAAGEVYTLGALARLYADAGVKLDEAQRLAERHASIVRLPESAALLQRIQELL